MRTYLFDFDGTLVDSMPTYKAVMLRVLDENNVAYPPDIMKTITPLGYAGTAKYYREQLGMSLSQEEIISTLHSYAIDEYTYNVPAKPHVIDALHRLKARGDSLNVLTASPHAMLDPCLKRLGIYSLFDNVWSCDDFNTTKADPEIYRMAALRIGEKVENILFLDDNYNADRVARSAGMLVCGVYDATSAEYADEIKSVSNFYITDFSTLPDLW